MSELETWIDRFEDAWQRGERPSVEAFLPPDKALRSATLIELVYVDLEYRLKAGEPARVEEYLQRFPELAADAEVLAGLVTAERRFRMRQGEAGTHRELHGRFPQLASTLDVNPRLQSTPTVPAAASVAETGRLGK